MPVVNIEGQDEAVRLKKSAIPTSKETIEGLQRNRRLYNKFLSTNVVHDSGLSLGRPKSSINYRRKSETMGEKGSQCRLSTVLPTGEEEQPVYQNLRDDQERENHYHGPELLLTPNAKSTLLQSVNIKSVYQTKSDE